MNSTSSSGASRSTAADDGQGPLSNMRGIEIYEFAVQLARVTLWMGQKRAVDELGLDHEQVLPTGRLDLPSERQASLGADGGVDAFWYGTTRRCSLATAAGSAPSAA